MELGTLEHQSLADADTQPEGGAGLVSEDDNGNGALDEGEDRNGNGALDSGLDVDADGILEEFEIVQEGDVSQVGMLPANLSEIWTLTSDAEFDPSALFTGNTVALVQQGPGEDQPVLACGVLTGVSESSNQQFTVSLLPAGDETYQGMVIFGTDTVDTGETEGTSSKGIRVIMFQPSDSASEQAATPTS
jgi:hypothetical protein